MVSGFFTSPCDHSRILSGLASEMRIALNESGSLGFSKKLKMSLTSGLLQSSETLRSRRGGGGRQSTVVSRQQVVHGTGPLSLRRRAASRREHLGSRTTDD